MARPRIRERDRKARTPLGVPRQKLTIDSELQKRLAAEGKVPRWVNDEMNGRIQHALDGDYEFISDLRTPVKTGTAKEEQDQDRRIKRQVGEHRDGSPKFAYLMAIPEQFYEEDQQAKEAVNAKVDEAVRGGRPAGLSDHGLDPDHGRVEKPDISYKP